MEPSGHASKVVISSNSDVMDIINRTTDGTILGKEDFPKWFDGLSKQDIITDRKDN